MTTDADKVAEGAAAWSKINSATNFEAWKAICLALAIGRQHALRETGANAPHGARYSRSFNAWLAANGFSSMPFGLRAACLRVADDLEAIELWRAGLPDGVRASQNHPEVILRNFRRAHRAEAPPPARLNVVKGAMSHKGARAIHWPQDAIRRAAHAMREARSSDFYILARVALVAAIRDEIDLLELLPAPTRAPKPAAALALG